MKYVTSRENSDGSLRWYWQRRGYPLTRLPDDPVARYAVAMRLNAEAEGRKTPRTGSAPDSLAAIIEAYQETDRWRDAAPATRDAYGVWLRRYSRSWGAIPVAELDRNTIVDFLGTIESRANKRLAASVLQVVLDHACYRGLIQVNHASNLRLPKPRPRSEYFTLDDVQAWRAAASQHRLSDQMGVAMSLMLYTAQRPSDCLAMPWTHYDGDAVRLRQEKTRKLMSVPCHEALRTELDSRRLARAHTLICAGLTYEQFNGAWNQIVAIAGMPQKQARDVRRSSVVLMTQAGCSNIEISHITGHSLTEIADILDTVYLVRTPQPARDAMAKLETFTRARK